MEEATEPSWVIRKLIVQGRLTSSHEVTYRLSVIFFAISIDLQLIKDGKTNSPIASTEDVRKFQYMPLSRRLFRIFIIASLPLTAVPSLAHMFPYDPSAPDFLKTPPTGTGLTTAAKDQIVFM